MYYEAASWLNEKGPLNIVVARQAPPQQKKPLNIRDLRAAVTFPEMDNIPDPPDHLSAREAPRLARLR